MGKITQMRKKIACECINFIISRLAFSQLCVQLVHCTAYTKKMTNCTPRFSPENFAQVLKFSQAGDAGAGKILLFLHKAPHQPIREAGRETDTALLIQITMTTHLKQFINA